MLIDYSKNSVPYHQKRSGYATDLELPKASVAASLAKKFGTINGRVRRSNAAAKAL